MSSGSRSGKRCAKRPSASCTIWPRSAGARPRAEQGQRLQLQDVAGEDRVGVGDPRLDRGDAELARAHRQRRARLGRAHGPRRPAMALRACAQASQGCSGASDRPMPFTSACSRSSQREGTVGAPSTLAARVSTTRGAPSCEVKSCAASPMRSSGAGRPSVCAHRPVEPGAGIGGLRPRALVERAEDDDVGLLQARLEGIADGEARMRRAARADALLAPPGCDRSRGSRPPAMAGAGMPGSMRLAKSCAAHRRPRPGAARLPSSRVARLGQRLRRSRSARSPACAAARGSRRRERLRQRRERAPEAPHQHRAPRASRRRRAGAPRRGARTAPAPAPARPRRRRGRCRNRARGSRRAPARAPAAQLARRARPRRHSGCFSSVISATGAKSFAAAAATRSRNVPAMRLGERLAAQVVDARGPTPPAAPRRGARARGRASPAPPSVPGVSAASRRMRAMASASSCGGGGLDQADAGQRRRHLASCRRRR